MDLPRQIHEGTPYPVKALFAMGLNYRILPDDQYFKSAMEKLDFFVDADLFMTDAAKWQILSFRCAPPMKEES